MSAVNISGTFKKDNRPDNGLESISLRLVKDELKRHVVVGIVELHKVVKEPGEAPIPTVHFVAIEPLDDDQADTARLLLNIARTNRGMGDIAVSLFDAAPREPWDPDTDPDLLELAEREATKREAGIGPALTFDEPTFDEAADEKRRDDE